MLRRSFGTSAAQSTNTNTNDPCNTEEELDGRVQPDQEEQCNEVLKVIEAGQFRRVYENIPNMSDYDVLIRTDAVAISGSDIHVFETGGKSSPGITLGHDAAGVIEKIGRCIYNLKPGDRVAIESGLSCGICDFCKRGLYNMCAQLIYNGFLSKYQVHPADLCHKLPYSVSLEEAALTHTLALGCQACIKAHITPITKVLVIGANPTAVAAALSARSFGACKVIVTSVMHYTLESIRRNFGFDFVLYDECNQQHSEALEQICCALHDWPDVVINCAISETTMNLAVMSLQACGTLVLAECDAECACFNAMDVLMKNLRIVTSFRSTNMYPTAIHLLQSGQAPVHELIARIYLWPQVEAAFRAALHESNIGYKKVIVKCDEEENCKTVTKS